MIGMRVDQAGDGRIGPDLDVGLRMSWTLDDFCLCRVLVNGLISLRQIQCALQDQECRYDGRRLEPLAELADPGLKLPTRRELAEQYGVADMTIGRALEVLKDEGVIETVPGLGVFVAGTD